MMENIESMSSHSIEDTKTTDYSKIELEFIKECINPPQPEELAMRIDDIQGEKPPKAIDSDPKIAEAIEPIRDQIPSKYLEAPNDMEQVNQISDVMRVTNGLKLEEWKELSLDQRVELLNQLESKIAAIEHRPACPITVENLGELSENNGRIGGHLGYHENGFSGERIVINSELVKSDNPNCYFEVLDTVLHEGRHSYQTYNMEQRQTHTSHGDLTNWKTNLDQYGYQNAQLCGFKLYWMQPVEADARKFAEDVLTAYKEKTYGH